MVGIKTGLLLHGLEKQVVPVLVLQIFSYIILTVEFIIAVIIKDTTISGIIISGDFIQTLTITRIAYQITNNKYGHEVYANI